MLSRVGGGWAATVLGAALAISVAGPVAAGSLAPADCNDLDLHIDASFGTPTCRAASLSNADARGRAESVQTKGALSFVYAEHVVAGIHTYIERSAPKDVVDRTNLADRTKDWGPQFENHGFAVRRFAVTTETGGLDLHCVAFAKHWGHVPQSTGYGHRIVGFYCSALDQDVADAGIDRLLASVRPTD